MKLSTLVERLDERLGADDYADIDASANGLQVGPEEKEIERVAFAVDGVVETFQQAAAFDADLLVVHHGIVWGGLDRVTGLEYDRIRTLLDNDIALYVSHLPLDGHPEYGNAARIADLLGLEKTEAFGHVGGVPVGRRGTAPDLVTAGELRDALAESLPIEAADVQVIDHGPDELEEFAVVTGAGADFLREAKAEGIDALVTGEGKQKLYHEAQEADISVFLAGHYATETVGVRSVQSLVDEWDLETTFIDVPTGL